MIMQFDELELALFFVKNALMCFVAWLSMMLTFDLYPFEVRLSNCILYALKMLLSSRPATGVASIVFVS